MLWRDRTGKIIDLGGVLVEGLIPDDELFMLMCFARMLENQCSEIGLHRLRQMRGEHS